jgi:hypothetical protein
MVVFISKYELRTVTIKKISFNIGTIHSYTVEMNRVILPKCTVASYKICFYTIKCYISFELTCFGAVK